MTFDPYVHVCYNVLVKQAVEKCGNILSVVKTLILLDLLVFKSWARHEKQDTSWGGTRKNPLSCRAGVMWLQTGGGGGQRLSKVVVLHRSPWQPSDRGYATADQTLFYPAEGFNDVSRERGGGVALFSAVDLFAGSAPRSLLGFSLLLLPLCLILNTALLNQKSS